jgi:hypothetical protein
LESVVFIVSMNKTLLRLKRKAHRAFLRDGKRQRKHARPICEAVWGTRPGKNIFEWLAENSREREIAVQTKREIDYLVKMFVCKEVN